MVQNLESMVKEELVFVASDIHVPYQDDTALNCFYDSIKKNKPSRVVLNGDLVDFYNLSVFDKNPDRKGSVQEELVEARKVLKNIRKVAGTKCKIYMTEGNHENRLQRYLWRNPELEGLEELDLGRLLKLKESNISLVRVSGDYWKKDTGHLKIGDLIVTHGDNRLNGSSTSKYSGYSAKNTMMNIQSSMVIGHVHRLAQVYHTTPYGTMVGLENGCLCQYTGTANWQQGFVSFKVKGNKTYDHQIHRIEKGKLT